MLVYVCFIILNFAGGALSGHKPPDYDPPAFRYDSKNPEHHVYKAHAEAKAYAEAAAAQEETISDHDGKSIIHSNSKSSSFSKSSSYTSVVSHHCGGKKCSDPNAVYKERPSACPLTCDHPNLRPCNKMPINKGGCECAKGFVLNADTGTCVRPKHCPEPIRCPKNSHYVMNDNQCLKTCGNRILPNSDVAGACVPFTGCACKPGYVRKYDNATGPCIKEGECPPIPTQCGENEIPTSCAIICPPQTCESMFTDYHCLPTECEPGCDCRSDFMRKDGVCIPSEDCFEPDPIECGPNEVYSNCAITCPPQTCESLFVEYDCAEPICAPGCNCFDEFLRNSLGDCVPIGECYNDTEGCNGDLNATRVHGCSGPSRPTCENPEPGTASDDICELNGCECKPGYIESYDDGDCIDIKDCPGGSPKCGANQTYVGCKFGCPTNYCPVDDIRAQVACSLQYPCQGGCACKAGYLIVSREDPRCVKASDCPKVKCTRPNEVWDPDPTSCFSERCEDRDSECDYPTPPGPRCVCKEGFHRNDDDTCIPDSECPQLSCDGDYNATLTVCPNNCPKTCDDPYAGDDGCIEICGPTDCQCNTGYFLTKLDGGICIKPEDCGSCGGDPNAKFSNCPSACEPTCTKSDRNRVCTRQCMPPGCVCRDGFVLNQETGKCTKPESCPSGCGGDPNAVYTTCTTACEPTCDNPDPQICTLQCLPPSCVCKPGFVKSKDGKCIKPETCPGGCGGDPNAVYTTCTTACEPTCDNPDPQICTLQCLPPSCVCKPGFVKSKDGKCIKPEKCPDGCGGDPNAVYTTCTSACEPTCNNPDPQICTLQCLPPSCVCKPGFVKSKDGKCIKPETCPVVDKGCNGDLNATHSDCPSFCPPTCENRNNKEKVFCPAVCDPSGCVCKQGYMFIKKGGKCVLPEDCPVPSCKDPNAVYKRCPSACEPTCTNPDPKFCTKQCTPPRCVCKPDYVLNENTGKCVKREKCPGGCGGDPNAVNSTCPTACEPTCDNPDPQICTLQCLPPGCICKPGFVKSKDGKCIKPETCPGGCGGDPNAVYTTCTTACEPTCDNPDPQICTLQCLPPSCVCKSGFVKSKDGKCIKPETCLETDQGCKGDPKAEYNDCPSACEPTCSNPDPNQVCTEQCLPAGCVCKQGLVLNEESGKCVERENCPVDCGCKGDMNATYSDCTSRCPTTCADLYHTGESFACAAVCGPPGCVCKPDFVLIDNGGRCVLPEDCPETDQGCKGDPKAEYNECPSACEPTCSNPDPNQVCTEQCLPAGCVCKQGLVLNEKTGKCVEQENCPVDCGCKGDMNATYSDCTSRCPTTCADLYNTGESFACAAVCGPPGCVCKPDFVLIDNGGRCVLPEDCPETDQGCKGDPKAEYNECPSACEPTCSNPDPNQVCTEQCLPAGCVCKQGLVLNEKTGKCVEQENCPVDCGCKGDMNATYSDCTSRCPTTCADLYNTGESFACAAVCGPPGCVCKPDFVLIDNGGRCVLPEDCPETDQGCKGDPKAEYNECPSACEPTCSNPDPNQVCTEQCLPAGCVCKQGLVLNEKTGKCVEQENCPVDCGCKGDMNATYSDCTSRCPTTCADLYNTGESFACAAVCGPPGCVCKPDFVLIDNGGRCVLPEDCPDQGCKGDPNAEYRECPSACPATCENPNTNQACTKQCMPPGCVCKRGFVKSKNGKCIKPESCPVPGCGGDPNAMYSTCPSACEPTCDNPDPQICTLQCLPPGCVCKQGFVKSKDGKCIKPETCPAEPQCKGDRNATYKEDRSYCQATCKNPDPERQRMEMPMTPGCECKHGYLWRNKGGPCIKPEDCPGGWPTCRANETYVYCNVGCPTNYCPVDDSLAIVACDPPYPCPGGCACKGGYLMVSEDHEECILASECPKVNCTRPNEVWDPNAPGCLHERCDDKDIPCDFQYPGPPRCRCIKGYYRDKDDICVPECQCPKPEPVCGYNEVAVTCRQICPPQNCEIAYTEYACTEETKICEPGCNCLPDHLRNGSGICIPNDQCPYPSTPVCGINEIARDCKRICPPQTCQSKYIMYNCIQDIPCEPGCDCVSNYLRDERGICIPSEKCPPLPKPEPVCGHNEVAVPCRQICPPQNCEIAYTDYACTEESKICEPGCDCLPDHLRNGSGICIPNDQCPYPSTPVCGINEIARDCKRICPPQTCLSKYALFRCVEDLPCEPGCDCVLNYLRDDRGICIPSEQCPAPKTEPVCGYNEVAVPCRQICPSQNFEIAYTEYAFTEETNICEPGCNCIPDHLRNGSGICIPNNQCPSCQISDECKRTCARPNPKGCVYNPPQNNMKGCDCKEGFILSDSMGECIPIDQCPPDIPCHGDPNARPKRCPKACPSTCESPNQIPCKRKCEDIACECNFGYLLSNDTDSARCILPDKCPGGNPCGKCGRFVDCKTDCKGDYCPVDDSRDPENCDYSERDCLSGCICKINHKRKSREDPRCILSSKCHRVNCTRPNEKWSSCPSACLAENCEDINNQPITCNPLILNCEPRCICKKNHFRNSRGICVPAKKCPAPGCGGDQNAVHSDCPSACEPTCDNPDPQICTDQCMPAGCVCKNGFVLNKKDGKCVKRKNCPDS